MERLAIGVDIGGTNTVIAVINSMGEILLEKSFSTRDCQGFDAYVSKLSSELEQVIANYKVVGIGIGAPNVNCNTGCIEKAPNLNWGENAPLKARIQQIFPSLTVEITNDANAAALGEMKFGGAKKMRDFAVITLGTGLGSGFVVDGKLLTGFSGFAGELGHITVAEGGRLCGCGRKGCLETYVSATGITRTMKEISGKDLSSKDIFLAAVAGDTQAQEAFEITGKFLGLALSNLVCVLSPQAIFLFGGLVHAGDLIFEPTIRYFNDNMQPVFKDTVKILPSELSGAKAAVLGAGAQVF